MKNLVLVADDLTGAGDAGVTFARGGLRTTLLLDNSDLGDVFMRYDALSASTESRFMTPGDAAQAVGDLMARCRRAGGKFFFKKVDSVMRGSPGAETLAALKALDYRAAIVCPALPHSGRVVVDGILLVDGVPISETPLGRDPFTPVTVSSVAECFAAGSGVKTGLIRQEDVAGGIESVRRRLLRLLEEKCVIIASDAGSAADLEVLSRLLWSTLPPILPVGSSGLARALAGPPAKSDLLPRGRLLAVVGSLMDMALEQADQACEKGFFTRLPVDIDAGVADPGGECARLLALAEKIPGRVLLTGLRRPKDALSSADAGRVADLYARIVARVCGGCAFQAVYATGGSVAVAVAKALGIESLTLESEILPGVVLSSCVSPGTEVRQFVTKSGSFGSPDSLIKIASAFAS